MRPIELLVMLVNHRFPSGPAAIPADVELVDAPGRRDAPVLLVARVREPAVPAPPRRIRGGGVIPGEGEDEARPRRPHAPNRAVVGEPEVPVRPRRDPMRGVDTRI